MKKISVCIILLIALLLMSVGCNDNGNKEIPKYTYGDDKLIDNNVKFSSEVVPINWDKFNTDILKGELAEGIIYLLNNGTKYIVNDWYDNRGFRSQGDREYLNLGGNGEHNIRPVSEMARTLALTIKLNVYNEGYTGVSEDDATAMAVKLIKSLAKAHLANTQGGWGNAWQSAFWTADIAHAAWLLWDEFSNEDKVIIQNCIVHEADRFINYESPYYMDRNGNINFVGDSKAEENSWNSNILSVVCAMMPNHENYNAWMHKNVELMISAFAVPDDINSDRIVSGYMLRDLLDGSNVNPDGTVVNHNIIHPDYQSTLAQNLLNATVLATSNVKIPEACLFNSDIIYKSFVDLDVGSLNEKLKGEYIYKRKDGKASHEIVYPNGTDWGTDRQINFFLMDVYAYVLGFDKDCSLKGYDFAIARIPVMKAMQDRNSNGQYYVNGDSDRYQSREEWVMWHASAAYYALWASENNLYNFTNDLPLKPAPLTEVKIKDPGFIKPGEEVVLDYSFNKGIVFIPEDSEISFSSSNSNILSVTKDGILTAKKEGSADISITVKYKDIEISDTRKIEVAKVAVMEFTFNDLDTGTKLYPGFKWNGVGSAVIKEDNGNNYLELSGGSYNFIYITEDFSGDFSFEFKMKLTSHVAKGGGQVLFRENKNNGSGKQGYQMVFGDVADGSFGAELRKRDGSITDTKSVKLSVDNEWHKFKIVMENNNVKLYMDGKQIISHTLKGFDSGSLALCSYLDTVYYDDIVITYL